MSLLSRVNFIYLIVLTYLKFQKYKKENCHTLGKAQIAWLLIISTATECFIIK